MHVTFMLYEKYEYTMHVNILVTSTLMLYTFDMHITIAVTYIYVILTLMVLVCGMSVTFVYACV